MNTNLVTGPLLKLTKIVAVRRTPCEWFCDQFNTWGRADALNHGIILNNELNNQIIMIIAENSVEFCKLGFVSSSSTIILPLPITISD